MGSLKRRKGRHQITFRISPRAAELLERKAVLFQLEPNMYAKAVIYVDIGAWGELLDRRRQAPKTVFPEEMPEE